MARRPISMRKTREILRLKHEVGLSNHQIAASLHLSHVCVGNYLRRARQAGVGWPIPDTLADEQLEQRLRAAPPLREPSRYLPPIAEVRPAVAREWENERRAASLSESYRKLRSQYVVVIEAKNVPPVATR